MINSTISFGSNYNPSTTAVFAQVNADSITGTIGIFGNLTATNQTIINSVTTVLNSTNVIAQNISVTSLTANSISSANLTSNRAWIQVLSGTSANFISLTSNSISSLTLSTGSEAVTFLWARNLYDFENNLDIVLTSSNIGIGKNNPFTKLDVAGSISATNLTAITLVIGSVSGTNLTGISAYVNSITSNNLSAFNINSTNGFFISLTSNGLSAITLSALSANIGSITAFTISAVNANFFNLTANDVTFISTTAIELSATAGLSLSGSLDVTGSIATLTPYIGRFSDQNRVVRLYLDQAGNLGISNSITAPGLTAGTISANSISAIVSLSSNTTLLGTTTAQSIYSPTSISSNTLSSGNIQFANSTILGLEKFGSASGVGLTSNTISAQSITATVSISGNTLSAGLSVFSSLNILGALTSNSISSLTLSAGNIKIISSPFLLDSTADSISSDGISARLAIFTSLTATGITAVTLSSQGLTSIGSSNFILSGGNVGIGTTNPAAKLDINGTLSAQDNAFHAFSHTLGSPAFTSGVFGSGWRLDTNLAYPGQSFLEIDNLRVRGVLAAAVFKKDIVRVSNGYLLISDASNFILNVGTGDSFIYVQDPVFQEDDIVWSKNIEEGVGPTQNGLDINSEKMIISSSATVTAITTNSGLNNSTSSVTGYQYSVQRSLVGVAQTFKAGDTIVRIGNAALSAGRTGTILLDASSEFSPFIDVMDQIDSTFISGSVSSVTGMYLSNTASSSANIIMPKIMTRFGKLSGITSPTWGNLNGYGLWGQNIWLEGNIAATAGYIGTKAAGWGINSRAITSSGLTADAVDKAIYINGTSFGSDGIQLQYNGGTPRAYIGDGAGQFFKFDGTKISFSGTNVSLDTNGNFSLSGSITAKTGTIGGWNIGATTLSSTNNAIVLDSSTPSVKVLGVLTAQPNSLVVSGTVSSTQGSIGNWKIGTTTLSSSDGHIVLDPTNARITVSSAVNNTIILDDAGGLWLGNAASASAPFHVDTAGNLTANNAVLSGNITAAAGYIGSGTQGWTIGPSAISSQNNSIILDANKEIISVSNTANSGVTFFSTSPSGTQILGILAVGSSTNIGNTFYVGPTNVNLVGYSDTVGPNSPVGANLGKWSSTNYGGGDWAYSLTSVLSPRGIIEPVGQITHSQGAGDYRQEIDNLGTISGRTFTFSLWINVVQAKTSNSFQVSLGDSNDRNIGQTIVTTASIANGWTRLSHTTTFGISSSAVSGLRAYLGQNIQSAAGSGLTANIWGAQVEENSAPTIYQSTRSSTAYSNTFGVMPSTGWGMWATNGGFGGTIQNPAINLSDSGMWIGNTSETAGNRINITASGISGWSGSINTFTLDDRGNLVLSGTVSAAAGNIGGWSLNPTKLSSTAAGITADSNIKALYIQDSVFGNNGIQMEYNAGSPQFFVGASSAFMKYTTASGLLLSGSLSANTGKIGGWNVNATQIYNNNFTIDSGGSISSVTGNTSITLSNNIPSITINPEWQVRGGQLSLVYTLSGNGLHFVNNGNILIDINTATSPTPIMGVLIKLPNESAGGAVSQTIPLIGTGVYHESGDYTKRLGQIIGHTVFIRNEPSQNAPNNHLASSFYIRSNTDAAHSVIGVNTEVEQDGSGQAIGIYADASGSAGETFSLVTGTAPAYFNGSVSAQGITANNISATNLVRTIYTSFGESLVSNTNATDKSYTESSALGNMIDHIICYFVKRAGDLRVKVYWNNTVTRVTVGCIAQLYVNGTTVSTGVLGTSETNIARTLSIDVQGLTNGTVYQVKFQLESIAFSDSIVANKLVIDVESQ